MQPAVRAPPFQLRRCVHVDQRERRRRKRFVRCDHQRLPAVAREAREAA